MSDGPGVSDGPSGGDEPSDEPADEPATKGDFETGDLSDWDTSEGTELSKDAAYSGDYGVNLKGDGSKDTMLGQTFEVEAGKEYTMTFMLKVNAAGLNVQVKDGDKNGATLADGSYTVTTVGEWTKIEMTFVANSDKVYVDFFGDGSGEAADVYVDDLTLTAAEADKPADKPADDTASPETGVGMGGVAVASVLAAASMAIARKLGRKKEEEN